jgi:hypothetical protein
MIIINKEKVGGSDLENENGAVWLLVAGSIFNIINFQFLFWLARAVI